MTGLDFRILAAHLREDALPKLVAKGEGVRFIAHQHLAELVRARVGKAVADDALHAAARVDVFLYGDLLRIAAPELAAQAGVKPFGIFAKDDEVDVVFAAVAQGRERGIEQFHGAGIHVKVELCAQSQKNVGGVPVRRHTRIAHGAKKDGVEVAAEHLHGARRKRRAVAQKALRAPVEIYEVGLALGFGDGGLKYSLRFRYYFNPDTVAGNDGDSLRGWPFSGGSIHNSSPFNFVWKIQNPRL